MVRLKRDTNSKLLNARKRNSLWNTICGHEISYICNKYSKQNSNGVKQAQ